MNKMNEGIIDSVIKFSMKNLEHRELRKVIFHVFGISTSDFWLQFDFRVFFALGLSSVDAFLLSPVLNWSSTFSIFIKYKINKEFRVLMNLRRKIFTTQIKYKYKRYFSFWNFLCKPHLYFSFVLIYDLKLQFQNVSFSPQSLKHKQQRQNEQIMDNSKCY